MWLREQDEARVLRRRVPRLKQTPKQPAPKVIWRPFANSIHNQRTQKNHGLLESRRQRPRVLPTRHSRALGNQPPPSINSDVDPVRKLVLDKERDGRGDLLGGRGDAGEGGVLLEIVGEVGGEVGGHGGGDDGGGDGADTDAGGAEEVGHGWGGGGR